MVYDAVSFERLFTVKLSNDVTRIDINPENTLLAAACDDHDIHIIDLDQQRETVTLRGHQGRVWQAIFNHKGDQLLSGAMDRIICVWDTKTWTLIRELDHHTDLVRDMQISRDDEVVVSCSPDKTICVAHIATGALIRRLTDPRFTLLFTLALTPDGLHVIVGDQAGTFVFSIEGSEVLQLAEPQKETLAINFSPDDQLLAIGCNDSHCYIYEWPGYRHVKSIPTFGEVKSVLFNVDSAAVWIGTYRCTVTLRSCDTGNVLEQLDSHGGAVWGLAMTKSSSGKLIGTWSKYCSNLRSRIAILLKLPMVII